MTKALRETQTLRTGCRKAESKKFAPLQTPFPGVRDCQNLISCRWSLYNLYLLTQFGKDRCTQFRVIVVTDPETHTHKSTDRTNYNTLHRSFANAQCNHVTPCVFDESHWSGSIRIQDLEPGHPKPLHPCSMDDLFILKVSLNTNQPNNLVPWHVDKKISHKSAQTELWCAQTDI